MTIPWWLLITPGGPNIARNQIETIYREAIAQLFSGPEDVHHIMSMLRIREVYRHISNAGDQADQAANVIGKVVVKMT